MFKRFYNWFRKDHADNHIEQRETEYMSEKAQGLGQKNIDSAFRQSEKNQEKSIKSIEFKINESENGYLSFEVLSGVHKSKFKLAINLLQKYLDNKRFYYHLSLL